MHDASPSALRGFARLLQEQIREAGSANVARLGRQIRERAAVAGFNDAELYSACLMIAAEGIEEFEPRLYFFLGMDAPDLVGNRTEAGGHGL